MCILVWVGLTVTPCRCAQCLVFGAVGVGKSTLLAGLAGQQSPSGSPGAAGSGVGGQSRPTAAGRVEIGGEYDPLYLVASRTWVETLEGKNRAMHTSVPP